MTHQIIKPPRAAALAALAGLAANALLLAVLAGTAIWAIALLSGGGVTSTADRVCDILAVGSAAEYGLTVLTAVPVIVWLWRARTNADVIDIPDGWGRPWVIFGWFVPFLNLRVPRAIVGAVWRASAPPGASIWQVNAWWATWLIYLAGVRLSSRLTLAGTGGHIGNVLTLYVPVAVDGVAAAVFGALVVWRLTRFQEDHAVRLAAAVASAPGVHGPALGGEPAPA